MQTVKRQANSLKDLLVPLVEIGHCIMYGRILLGLRRRGGVAGYRMEAAPALSVISRGIASRGERGANEPGGAGGSKECQHASGRLGEDLTAGDFGSFSHEQTLQDTLMGRQDETTD